MSEIRCARQRHGVGVRELARMVGVTPAAVLKWEDAEDRGVAQLSTIRRALAALGEELQVGTSPRRQPLGVLVRREDRVSRELHRSVAAKLVTDPDSVLELVPVNTERKQPRVKGQAVGWVDEWRALAAGHHIGAMVDLMLGSDQHSIDMRQVSPFAGVLTQAERSDAIARALHHESF